MKKSVLWTGIAMIAVGLCLLAAAIFWDTPLDSLLCGFSGAFFGPGIVQICKYVKWTKLETEDSWRRHVEEEQIELRDERKSMLRDRSGRYAYVLGMLLACAAMVVFSIFISLSPHLSLPPSFLSSDLLLPFSKTWNHRL